MGRHRKHGHCSNEHSNNSSPGVKRTVSQWSKITGISIQAIYWRLKVLKMTPEEILTTKMRVGSPIGWEHKKITEQGGK
jgi:hypothetical protein